MSLYVWYGGTHHAKHTDESAGSVVLAFELEDNIILNWLCEVQFEPYLNMK